MCKVMLIAGIKQDDLPKVQKLVKAGAKAMSFVEDDGVGYAAITSKGKVYGEKWLNKDDAFNLHAQPKPDSLVQWLDTMFGDAAEWKTPPTTHRVYDTFGTRDQDAINDTVAVILHARKSTTGGKVIENVHPFAVINDSEHPDTALIHNGSIINHTKLTKTMSTCDSEVILHEYLSNQMYFNPWGIEEVAKTLIGEYVVGVLTSGQDEDGPVPLLDIFKSGNKELYAGWVPELQTVVFCTTDHCLESAVKDADMTVKYIVKIKEGNFLRIDAVSGVRSEDIITFTTSLKYDNSNYDRSYYGTNHGHHGRHTALPGPLNINKHATDNDITATDDDSMENAKKDFERKHPALFNYPYVEVSGELTTEERDYFAELEKGTETNHAALHLVSLALGMKNG